MPTTERDVLGENDTNLRHQNSLSSEGGRAIVPMWDSSDPERAPPPLPMNPSSPGLIARSNTSSIVQSAHVALVEKAWETNYVTNPPPKRIDYSPERLLMKGVTHKRIKSLQPSARDLNSSPDGSVTSSGRRSPEKSTILRGSSLIAKEIFSDTKPLEKELRNIQERKSPEREPRLSHDERSFEKHRNLRYEEKHAEMERGTLKENRKEECSSQSNTPSPDHKDRLSLDTVKVPGSLRRPQQSILGENIPPQSATMLALQSMASKNQDKPLNNTTNSSTMLARTPQGIDTISNQILSLTNIATNLQKEVAQLSRRSRDNATDLISLKEATNLRDEDIRKSLRELVHNLNESCSRQDSNIQGSGGLYLDNKAHYSPGLRGLKSFSLPRISSPSSITTSLDRESIINPASYVADGVAIIALLEKVLREMATKEIQERILCQLSNCLTRNESSTEKKINDLILFIKANTSDPLSKCGGCVRTNRSRALSLEPPLKLELDFDKTEPLTASRAITLKPSLNETDSSNGIGPISEIMNDDIVKIIRTIKDSVTQGGGLTAEVKALVRELRGEVLGMGREIGRKLDEVDEDSSKGFASGKEHVTRLVKNGIEDLKTHMDQILREHRRQSIASLTSKTIVDYQEVCRTVRDAVIQIDQSREQGLGKQDIIDTIRDAWESYKPEIEFQQFGLERDELLTCLKEGIERYAPRNERPTTPGAIREEVYGAVVDGLKNFQIPCIDTISGISREEIFVAIRECLEEIEFPSYYKSIENILSRDDILDMVKEGLQSFDFSSSIKPLINSINMDLTRNDILEAVQNGFKELEASKNNDNSILETDDADDDQNLPCIGPKIDFTDRSEIDSFICQICDKFKNILDSTRTELKLVSEEVKKDICNSSDATETILNATQDGFQKIRAAIEDHVKDVTGLEIKENIIDMKNNIENFRTEIEWLTLNNTSSSPGAGIAELENLRDLLLASITSNTEAGNVKTLRLLQDGLENIKQTISSSLALSSTEVDANATSSKSFEYSSEERLILDKIKLDLGDVKETVSNFFITENLEQNKEEIFSAIKGGIENLQETISSSLVPLNPRLDVDEALGTIRDDLENIKVSMQSSLILGSSRLEKDEILNLVRDELENLKESISHSISPENSASHKIEVLGVMRDGIDSIKEMMSSSLIPRSAEIDKEDLVNIIKVEIQCMKESISSSLSAEGSKLDRDNILGTIENGFEDVKEIFATFLDSDFATHKTKIFEIVQDGFDKVKEELFILKCFDTGSEEMKTLDNIKLDLDEIKKELASSLTPRSSGIEKDEILSVIKDELDGLKKTMSSTLIHETSLPKNDKHLETFKNSFENFKQSMSSLIDLGISKSCDDGALCAIKKSIQDLKEEVNSQQSFVCHIGMDKFLDTIKAGFSKIQHEVEQVANKPSDSEFLNHSQEIFATLQADLKGVRADILQLQKSFQSDDLDNDMNNSAIVPAKLFRRDDIENLKALMTDLHIKVGNMDPGPSQNSHQSQESLSKSDLADIEQTIRNIQTSMADLTEKYQISSEDKIRAEDLEAIETLMRNTKVKIDDIDSKYSVNKDDLHSLECLIGETRDNLANLMVDMEDIPKKADVGVVESITRDVLSSFEGLQELIVKNSESPERITKIDLFAVESICSEIKGTLDQMLTTDMASLSSREDFKNLEDQVKKFKEQIDKKWESNFEERHKDLFRVNETLEAIQTYLEKFEDRVKTKIGTNITSTEALGDMLQSFGDVIKKNANISEDVKILSEVIKDEFEKSTTTVVGSKLELDEKLQQIWNKFESILEKRFGDILVKYDTSRIAAEEAIKSGIEKANRIETTLQATQIATEDLTILTNCISSSITESREEQKKNSNALSNSIEGNHSILKEIHNDTITEHQKTRDDVTKIFSMIEGIDSTLKECGPETAQSIKDLYLIANKQFEHSKNSVAILEKKISETTPRIESSALLLPPPPSTTENSIDNNAHEKLDRLLDGMSVISKSFTQLDILEKIHQQVIKTATEVSEFFTAQTLKISEDYVEKKEATEELSNILEKKTAQMDSIQATISGLRQEEEQLRKSVVDLKEEQDDLSRQKLRLYGEVSCLETALKIRREELDTMEVRADNLERRILENVVDHSRTFLISKAIKGREAMSRKRVSSHFGSTISSVTPKAGDVTQIAVDMVTTGNRSPKKNPRDSSRRILSLSQINSNTLPGIVKRSHSVREISGTLRKNSWNGTSSLNCDGLDEKNLRIKENEEYNNITEFDTNTSEDIQSTDSLETTWRRSEGSEGEVYTNYISKDKPERNEPDIETHYDTETKVRAKFERLGQSETELTDTFVVLYNEAKKASLN